MSDINGRPNTDNTADAGQADNGRGTPGGMSRRRRQLITALALVVATAVIVSRFLFATIDNPFDQAVDKFSADHGSLALDVLTYALAVLSSIYLIRATGLVNTLAVSYIGLSVFSVWTLATPLGPIPSLVISLAAVIGAYAVFEMWADDDHVIRMPAKKTS